MKKSRRVGKIIRQEFKMTTGNRAFVIITIIGPFLLIAVSVLPGLLTNRGMAGREVTVGVYGVPVPLMESLQTVSKNSNISFEAGASREELAAGTKEGSLQGFLVVPPNYLETDTVTYYSESGTDIYVSESVSGMLNAVIMSVRLRNEGVGEQKINSMMKRVRVETEALASGEKEDFGSVIFTSIAFVMLIYMTVLLYGQMIGRAVLMEKNSKTVEIMLSSVRPRELMMGKIFGRGLAGILQYGVWIAIAVVIMQIAGPLFDIELPASLTLINLGFMVLFFILAFFLYAGLYAALGAGAEDEQHLGQIAWPLILFLVLPMMLISVLVMDPGSTLSVVLSFFPMTAPVVMFVRLLISSPMAWEVLLCIGIMIVSIFLTAAGAAKIFRVGILMTGKKYTFREIMRWVRY